MRGPYYMDPVKEALIYIPIGFLRSTSNHYIIGDTNQRDVPYEQ